MRAVVALIALTLLAQPDPSSAAQKARDLILAGKPAEAISIYRELARTFPSNASLRLNLCIAEYQAKQFREAIVDANEALKLQPGLPSAELFLGASRLELGDFVGAIEPLGQARVAQPVDRNAAVFLAEALLGAGRNAEARAEFERAAELAAQNPRVWYGLGRSSEAVGDRITADRAWEQLGKLPPSRESYMHQAEVNQKSGEYVEAAKLWRDALRLSPADARVETSLVWALYKARDHVSALPLIDDLLSKNQQSAELNFLRGACLVNLEQPEQGLPYLEKAV